MKSQYYGQWHEKFLVRDGCQWLIIDNGSCMSMMASYSYASSLLYKNMSIAWKLLIWEVRSLDRFGDHEEISYLTGHNNHFIITYPNSIITEEKTTYTFLKIIAYYLLTIHRCRPI